MSKKIPMRQCIGCGEMKSKKELIRVLKTEDGGLVPDTTGRQNGRGAYLCNQEECLRKAIKTRGFDRSFHEKFPAEAYEELEKKAGDLFAK